MSALGSLCIMVVPLVFGATAAAQTPASNFEVLQKLCDQIALRADSIVGQSEVQALTLAYQAGNTQTPERLLSASMVAAFSQKSRLVFAHSDTAMFQNGASVVVGFRIIGCEVRYRKLPRPGWFRRAPIQREARVTADFDVYDIRSKRIYFQGWLAASRGDTLKTKVDKLETPTLPFTVGVWQTTENRRSWLEPVLLTAATGAIIYAFYSLRSQ